MNLEHATQDGFEKAEQGIADLGFSEVIAKLQVQVSTERKLPIDISVQENKSPVTIDTLRQPLKALSATQWMEKYRSLCYRQNDKGDLVFSLGKYVYALRDTHFLYLRHEDIYGFNGRVYEECKSYFENFMQETLIIIGKDSLHNIQDAVEKLKIALFQSRTKEEQWNSTPVIPVLNGLLDVSTATYTLRPYSPDYLIDWLVNAEWHDFSLGTVSQEQMKAMSSLERFIERILPDIPTITILWQFLGSSLARFDRRDHHLAYLFGIGRNGKSTLLNIIATLFEGAVTEIELADLEENRFAVYSLVQAAVNIVPDMSATRLMSTGLIKALTGDSRIWVEKKYELPFEARPRVKLWCAVNALPDTVDKAYGYTRRILIFPFTQHITDVEIEDNPYLEEELVTPEVLSYLLYLGVQGYKKIARREIKPSPLMEEALREYRVHLDFIVQAVTDEILEVRKGTLVPKDFLYKVLTTYAGNDNRAVPSANTIIDRLRALAQGNLHEKRIRLNNRRETVWEGVGITEIGLNLEYTKEVVVDDKDGRGRRIEVVKIPMYKYYEERYGQKYPYYDKESF